MDILSIVSRVSMALALCNVLAGSGMVLADIKEAAASARQQLRESTRFYEQIAGKPPTKDNLAASLAQIRKGSPKAQAEAAMALDVLTLSGGDTSWAKDAIRICYDAKSDGWAVKVSCVQAMLASDRDAGIALGLELVSDKQIGMTPRLFACSSLVAVGCVDGYGVLREGLESSDPQDHVRAISLFKRFISFNGTILPKTGEKIDLKALAEEFKGRVDQLSDVLANSKLTTMPASRPE